MGPLSRSADKGTRARSSGGGDQRLRAVALTVFLEVNEFEKPNTGGFLHTNPLGALWLVWGSN